MRKIGEVFFLKGEYEKALEYHNKALKINNNLYGNRHPNTCSIYLWIAQDYDALGNYGEAKNYYMKAYSYYHEKYGPDDARTQKVKEDLDRVEQKLRSENKPE